MAVPARRTSKAKKNKRSYTLQSNSSICKTLTKTTGDLTHVLTVYHLKGYYKGRKID